MFAAFADPNDLADRGITVPDGGADASVLLASASAAVRDAAGCPISLATSTVVLVADDWCELDLPGGPVQSVATVTVGGIALTGWQKIGDTIYLPTGWTTCLPVEVTVTYTHGYATIPLDIVDLVCGMVGMAVDQGYGSQLATFHLGEFGETYTHPAGTDSPSPMALPDTVRDRLRARFGTSVAVLATR